MNLFVFLVVLALRLRRSHGLSRMAFSAVHAGIGIVAAVGLLRSASAADASRPPNIILIISDDQAWTDYSFMGHPAIRTPHLDRLASQGVLFPRGYVPTPLCRPSLFSIATGQYAHRHRITGNDPSPKHVPPDSPRYQEQKARLISFADDWKTLPGRLGESGYVSFQSGKWWEGSFRRGGFTDGMTRGFPEKDGRHGDDGLTIGRQGLKPVLDFMDSAHAQGKPFFVWYAPFLPHAPHDPPERILKQYRAAGRPESIAKYYAMCEWFDETCGDLLNHLDRMGLRQNTLVAYVTDNGWIQDPSGPGFAPRSKQTCYEGGIRTPVLFSWPGHLPASRRTDLVTSLDLYPTLLAAAGVPVPEGLPGLNLLPDLQQGSPIRREAIYGEGFAHDIADLNNPQASLLYRWCIEGRWKLLLSYDGETGRYASIHQKAASRPQLYDLIADPFEKINRAPSEPEVVRRLEQRLNDWYPVRQRRVLTTEP